MQITVDLFEPKPTDEEIAAAGSTEDFANHKWNGLLEDLKMFKQYRTTKWVVERPTSFSFLKSMPEELIEATKTEQLIRHYHNWVIFIEYFNSIKSCVDFWDILAVDEGKHEGWE